MPRGRGRSPIGSRRSTRLRPTTSVHEVILSGGDPLMIVDHTLAQLVEELAAIPHLRRLRIHTRLPIVIPERVTDELVDLLRGTRLTPIVVVHANHANELDAHVAAALAKLSDAGIPLLNQAVLLARRERHDGRPGRALREAGRSPRDAVLLAPTRPRRRRRPFRSAHRNRPPDHRRTPRAAPGYAVPRYVAEIPATSKTVLD